VFAVTRFEKGVGVSVIAPWTMERILRGARKFYASDIHLIAGLAPVFRVNGEIRVGSGEALSGDDLNSLLGEMINDAQRRTYEQEWQLSFSRQWEGLGRFRVSVYQRAGFPEMSIRLCESVVRSALELGLPPIVEELTRLPNGLILVTGPTGMGKTTTMNFMIDSINRSRRCKIVTIEDPVEFVHENQRSIVVQQEVLTDAKSFRQALVHMLRQDPDVIAVGEMRDLETIETALTAAETGHLVLATLHTPDAVQTIQRIYSVFPAEQQNSVIEQLTNSLHAIVCQRLLPKSDGHGRVLATEICIATPAVRKHIRDHQPHHIFSELQTGKKYGMHPFDQSLLDLYQKAEITFDVCMSNARDAEFIRSRTGGSAPTRG
jgi:twitching motility protein PilT